MQSLHLPGCLSISGFSSPLGSTRRFARCHNSLYCSPAGTIPRQCSDVLRVQLAQQFPNTLLLEGQQLPGLRSSKHFINLTNGLELAPVLHQLHITYSAVRIRSTNLEQQSFEALMLELDANLLLSLALGHSCIVWDCGCRNRHNGAPRAIWYGLEFIRFALNRFWTGRVQPAHLRGYNVAESFEASCRKFHPTTKKRLRYYKRYLSESVQQHGVSLYGMFKRTDRDEDVDFFVDKAVQCFGMRQLKSVNGLMPDTSVQRTEPLISVNPRCAAAPTTDDSQQGPPAMIAGNSNSSSSEADIQAYRTLVQNGVGMFAAGLSHPQFIALQLNEPGVSSKQQQ